MEKSPGHPVPAGPRRNGEPVSDSPGMAFPNPQRIGADHREWRGFLIFFGILILTIAISLAVKKDKSLYVFGYIMAIVYVAGGPRRRGEPWSEVGVRPARAFLDDLESVWYLVVLVVLVFQFLPVGVAHLFGYYHPLIHYINARVSQVPALIGLALILTLFETIVYQVFVQQRLSRFIGTPAAIVVASVLAGLAHAASAGTGSLNVAVTDVAGVALDFAVFGVIWARTRNLALTWLTHYATDIIGILALAFILR